MRGFILAVVTAAILFGGAKQLRAVALGTLEATYNFHASGFLADPQRPYVYATAGSQLEVINTNTLAVAATVSLPGTSYGMAISSDGGKLYIGGSTGVFVMNTQTDALLPSLNLGYSVSQVATGLNNRLYVLGSNTLAQIDATSGASTGPNIQVIPLGVSSGGIQISPNGKTLYYASYGGSSGSLDKIDVSTTTPNVVWTNGTDIGENGENLALSHNGSMVAYVCGYGYQGYQIPNFHTSDMSLLGTFNTGAYPDSLAYSPNDKYAYAARTLYPTAVDIYDTTTYQQVGQFAVSDKSTLMTVDATGQHLFVSPDGTYYGNTHVCVYGVAIPEPSAFVLLVIAAISLLGWAWRNRAA